MMNKEQHFANIKEISDKNFHTFQKYFEIETVVFWELKSVVYEITNCLILELHRPALTLTNFLLERLLKIALIYNEVGLGPIDTKEWNKTYKLPHIKYSKLNFKQTIEKCRSADLINDGEENFLHKIAREIIRNGYGHADAKNITKNLPPNITAYQSTFDNTDKIELVTFERELIPTFQAETMRDFAKINAKTYFNFAYNLILSIDEKIKYFDQRNKSRR